MNRRISKRILSLMVCVVLFIGLIPTTIVSAEGSELYTTEYVKINSVDEIVPNARYIIVGAYTDAEGVITYHAMGKDNNPNDGFRYSYAQDQNGAHNFDISEDRTKITVYSYTTYDPILRVRIKPRDDEGRFYLNVDGEGYLCGYSDSTSDGANGHDLHSCLPIDDSTIGETWWYMRVPENGDYAGDWQIVNRSRLGNYSGYYYDVIQMGRPYPNSAGQFRAKPVSREDVGSLDEDEYIKYTVDTDTNIMLYREICVHRSEEVTHKEAVAATCGQPGILEYWYCAGCRQYFSDENMSNGTTIDDAVIAPPAHSYDTSGTCTVCGDTKNTVTFIEYEESSYGSDMEGELFIFVGFKDDKAYVMGNDTNADGSREAVEIPVKANGAITTSSDMAEFFTFEFNAPGGGVTFSPDGGYMSMMDGKIVVYDKSLVNEEGLPRPIRFTQEDIYQNSGYFYNWSDDLYIVFDADTLTFKVADTYSDSIVQYKQICSHANIKHIPGAEADCTEQGAVEYWYCDECYGYFMNNDFEKPVEINDVSELTKRAKGHKFDAEGVCENCTMKRNVYKPVTSLEQFDQLSENAYYLIVFKDSDRTYAARVPEMTYPCDVDANDNGILDLAEPDTNANGIPDCVESYIDTFYGGADANEDGVTTVEEYNEQIGDQDGDDDIGQEDYLLFYEYHVHWDQHMAYEEQAYQVSNFVEVMTADDGSITITDEGAMEFQMMESGVWGSQPNEDWMLEEYGVKDTDRLRAAWIPNWWVASGGMLGYYGEGHFMMQERTYGDREYPGVIDNKNWKISFNSDETVNMVCSWTDFDDTGALQLVKYGEDKMTIVGLPQEQWEYSNIMPSVTEKFPAYLYASEPVYNTISHECVWSSWIEDDVTDTHTRICTVAGCGEKQTQEHNWDGGVQTEAPTCTEAGTILYTCPDCNATKTDSLPALDHDWGDWTYDSVDSHVRDCKRNCGVTQEFEGHNWGAWVAVDDNIHKMTCSVCNGYQTGEHDWDNGKVTKDPTEEEEGVKIFTCTTCSHTKTEPIDKLVHECIWTDWYPNGAENHKRDCMDDNCNKFETLPHEWDDGVVIEQPTHVEPGVKTYTCTVCGNTRMEEILVIPYHEWSDWAGNSDGRTHTRICACGAAETLTHNWSDWTEQTAGGYTRTCTVCAASETMVFSEDTSVNTTVSNVANTNLINTDIELVDKILTDEEQSQLAGGAEVKIYLKVEDISNTAPAAHIAEAEAKAGNDQIGMYLDIDLFKQVGSAAETSVTETAGTVRITITIPDNLINTDDSVTRTYKIVRVHEDASGNLITDVIEGIFNPADNSFTFETDKFSTYALVYADSTVNGTPDGTQPDDNNSSESDDSVDYTDSTVYAESTKNNPSGIPLTGDDSLLWLWITLMILSGFGVVVMLVHGKKSASVK